MADAPGTYTLIRLEAENFKRLRALRLAPAQLGATKIAGANDAGKSSVLDCIEALLRDKRRHPDVPIRVGAASARAVGEFARAGAPAFTVTRKWTGKNEYLSVRLVGQAKDEPRPRDFLDSLIGAGFGFDPEAYLRLKPIEQVEAMLSMLRPHEDPRALDRRREELAADRAAASKEVASLEARLAAAPEPALDVPDVEISVKELADALEAANRQRTENQRVRDLAAQARREAAAAEQRAEGEIGRLREEIHRLQERLGQAETSLAAMRQRHEAVLSAAAAREATLVDPDTAALVAQIGAAEGVNAAVRAKLARRSLAEQVASRRRERDGIAVEIRRTEERKAEVLAAVEFPVPGMGFDVLNGSHCVTVGGVPLSQLGSATRMRVAMAVAMALNPAVRIVLIREGSLLDAEAMRVVCEMAEQRGFQVLLEVVGDGDETCWLLEDGEVVREPAKHAVEGQ